MHWYHGVRPDYWEQITSEVKAPTSRSSKRVWQKKSGVRNEAMDCEVYALHAARSLKLHLWSADRWQMELQSQIQIDLLPPVGQQAEESAPSTPAIDPEPAAKRDDFYDAFNGGNGSDDAW